jgi:hypothetical protein
MFTNVANVHQRIATFFTGYMAMLVFARCTYLWVLLDSDIRSMLGEAAPDMDMAEDLLRFAPACPCASPPAPVGEVLRCSSAPPPRGEDTRAPPSAYACVCVYACHRMLQHDVLYICIYMCVHIYIYIYTHTDTHV